jgi:hypothetical protein
LICGYLLLFGFIVEEAIDLVGVLEREGECEDVKLPRLLRCRGNDTGDTVEVRVGVKLNCGLDTNSIHSRYWDYLGLFLPIPYEN